MDSNRQSRRRTPFSEAGGDRPARWPEPDFDDRRGQIYLVPCRACSDNDINAGSPSFRKDANAGPCQPARFRALARRVPGDSVLRSPIFETPRSVDTTITPSRMISRIRPTHFVNSLMVACLFFSRQALVIGGNRNYPPPRQLPLSSPRNSVFWLRLAESAIRDARPAHLRLGRSVCETRTYRFVAPYRAPTSVGWVGVRSGRFIPG